MLTLIIGAKLEIGCNQALAETKIDPIKSRKSTLENSFNKSNKTQRVKTKIGILMAADNDLFPFARRNLKQLQNIGSNENVKIYVHFDLHPSGQPKMSKRLIIEKDKIMQVGPDMVMDSGDPNTLIDFCRWFITEDEPEDENVTYNYVIGLWNHGTGAIEPNIKHAFNPSSLWSENPTTNLIEINRNIGFLDFLQHSENAFNKNIRGICFDDTTGNYLTNLKLKYALDTVCTQYLKKKFSLIFFDACLMSMIEVANTVQEYAEIAVGSEEVELGTGYDYYKVLKPFLTHKLTPKEFAQHIVSAYHETYSKITNDYTQSALSLNTIKSLEANINQLSLLLIDGIKNQKNYTVKDAIKLSRHKNFCTHFDEPTYIDLDHFYVNLLKNTNRFELHTLDQTLNFRNKLRILISEGRAIIQQTVIANTVGYNLRNAKGIAIYFPDHQIHGSYYHSEFATQTNWLNFIMHYLA